MELPIFEGPDAPSATLEGDILTLHYATHEAYEQRVSADHATVVAAPGIEVVATWMPHVPKYLGYAVLVMRIAEAPIAAPAPVQSSRKSR